MAISTPKPRNVSDIKSAILQTATTSHYDLFLSVPTPVSTIMSKNGLNFGVIQDKLQLACSEATLPGSSLATLEINNDYTGVTERHAYRRVYDDRIDLTFYVDTSYTAIKFFETWIKFIMNESISGGPNNAPVGLKSPNFYYTTRYPEEYQSQFSIVKFEKDYNEQASFNLALRALNKVRGRADVPSDYEELGGLFSEANGITLRRDFAEALEELLRVYQIVQPARKFQDTAYPYLNTLALEVATDKIRNPV